MTYLQLRITLDPSGGRTKPRVHNILYYFIKHWLLPQDPSGLTHTAGYETLNKYGEPCDPHFHLNAHFDPPDLKDPLRSAKNWLKRKALEFDFSLKGNKVWSCTLVEEPQDFERWIRYPLKESPVPVLCSVAPDQFVPDNHFFEGTLDLKQLARDAQVERKRSIELNIIKRTKAIDKQSFRDKLFKHLDSRTDPWEGHQHIWISILEYYQHEGKVINFQTISGYTTLYQLHKGLLSCEQCYVMRSNPQ